MRSIALALLFACIALVPGCSRQPLNEKAFQTVWGEYIQREFEESFDEKKSISQREDLIKDVLKQYKIDADEFKQYMSKNHEDKYNKVFLNR
ncbi:MAG: hypothetical protein EPN93_05875 [Spirochaetes bacterium]|nr:MAG: hypothetical protein EPN93_05875 [Spirochaetota bacterium]